MESVYDQVNQWGEDSEYWMRLLAGSGAREVADLGCGTGMLTVAMARALRGSERGEPWSVTGVDPDPRMLTEARRRPDTHLVTWLEGDAASLDSGAHDLVTMTGHVSQVFVEDEDWAAVLAELHRVVRPGGTLAFDMRNPAARAWEGWTPEASRREIRTDEGAGATWHRVVAAGHDRVSYETVVQIGSQEPVVTEDTLRFRHEWDLRVSLGRAGFDVVRVDGTWAGTAAHSWSPELLVVARRA